MMRPLRILQVTDLFEPFVGGMEEHVKTLSQGLMQRGHQVTVATIRLPDTAVDEVTGGVRVRRITSWSSRMLAPWYNRASAPYHPPTPDPGVITQLKSLVSELRPDVVHAQGWITYSCLAGLAHRTYPLVVTIHDHGFVCAAKTLIRNGHKFCPGPSLGTCLHCAAREYGTGKGIALAAALRAVRQLHGRADSWVAVSRFVADTSRIALPRKCPITVIPPVSASPPCVSAAGQRPPWLPTDDYMLFVGAMTRFKGLHWLLEAYAVGQFQEPLVVLGTPRADTPRAWPPSAVVRTNVPHEEVMQAWSHARIGIVPTLCAEAFGLVAMEAMRSGVPVVASRVGALPSLVADGVTGLLVPPGDTTRLVNVIRLLNADPALRRRLGAAGKAWARRFSADVVTATYESHYGKLLAARGSP